MDYKNLKNEEEKYIIPNEYIFFEIDTNSNMDSIEKQVEELIKKLINKHDNVLVLCYN